MKIRNQFFQFFQKPENLFLTPVHPTPVAQPQIIGWSDFLAQDLQLKNDKQLTQVLAGNLITEEMKPYAARYGGHQFGHWAGQLGDGRAITLGELQTEKGFLELQLKGAGLTPYSRQGDGRAVLRSSLREFICSEAMYALGIPTTRALSLSLTGEKVVRDLLYDGNPQAEKGAITSRLSPSFVRFGNFEILRAGQNQEELQKLTDYVIEYFYPEVTGTGAAKYVDFLKHVSLRTADMLANWMSVGFVHGVMNTDNMSILGLTIDYGPYGWIEEFQPDFTPNTTDFSHRRYRYAHQPEIALWNLNALANALYSLIQNKESVIESLMHFQARYESAYLEKMSRKLGLQVATSTGIQTTTDLSPQTTTDFLNETYQFLMDARVDYTLFFRTLSDENFEKDFYDKMKHISYIDDVSKEHVDQWLEKYKALIASSGLENRIANMKAINPSIIFRNYLAQQAIDKADQGDYSLLNQYLKEFYEPFKDRDLYNDPITFKRPEWANNKPGCSYLSCSS